MLRIFNVYKQTGQDRYLFLGKAKTTSHPEAMSRFAPRAKLIQQRPNLSYFSDNGDTYKVQYKT